MKHLKLAGLTAAAVLWASGAMAQQITLKLHHFLGAKAPAQTQMLEPWVKRVEELSKGKVKIDIYPAMTLGGRPPELVQQARDGVVDLIWTLNGYTPGLFPRTEVFELPTVFNDDPTATNLAMRKMFDKELKQEYEDKGLEVLFLHAHAGNGIHTVDKALHSPADVAGLKLRTPSRTGAWVIEALKAQPVAMPVPELPQALSKKVVDGALIPWEIIPALKLQQQTKYQIEGQNHWRLGTSIFQVSMNKAKWDSLPDDVKAAFRQASDEEWLKEVGKIWRTSDDNGIKAAEAAGNELITLSPEETQAFKDAMQPVVARWEKEVSAQGIDGAALVKEARDLTAEEEKTLAQQ
ncbi:TRAP transporter substrate-binding protein [Thioclava atlantica]|uniref:TRAP dicarboxylate transporter subunit DctP n=1 Tax=Thioclava atlantica TaxID=1317124 RepID=A0A085TT62_9RHOB|nr:TRAP transporter substrate-binding protein [Thioclava atlantica]KFE33909.1 TRAP dicarboxylate transporter subunit DctP [Thioclava atlantica]